MSEPSIELKDPGEAHEAGAGVPAPLVVIEYRNPGLLAKMMPAALVMLAVVAITSFQRPAVVPFVPPRPNAGPVAPEPAPAPPVLKAESRGAPAVVAEAAPDVPQVVAPVDAEAAPAVAVAVPDGSTATANAEAAPTPSPFELSTGSLVPVAGAEGAAAGEVAAVAAGPEEAPPAAEAPEATKAEIVADIEREAREKEAERQRLAALKPKAEALLLAETVEKNRNERAQFRKDLRALFDAGGDDLPGAIDALCTQYGRSIPDEIRARYERFQRNRATRLTRADEVGVMRSFGLPEPLILDFLSNKMHKALNTRGGPRDAADVRVGAARQLLAIPLPTKPSAARTARPAALDARADADAAARQ